MDRHFFTAGAVSALLAVGLGAFGEHMLSARLGPERMAIYDVGVRYQFFHALGLMYAAFAWTRWPGRPVTWAGGLLVAGTVLFCGSLYALALTGVRWLGAITPLGGASWMAAWALLAWAVWGKRGRR